MSHCYSAYSSQIYCNLKEWEPERKSQYSRSQADRPENRGHKQFTWSLSKELLLFGRIGNPTACAVSINFSRPPPRSPKISSAKLIKIIFHYNRMYKHIAASWNRNIEEKNPEMASWEDGFSLKRLLWLRTTFNLSAGMQFEMCWGCTQGYLRLYAFGFATFLSF